MTALPDRVEDLLDSVDAAVFSGDSFHSPEGRARLEWYLMRWRQELDSWSTPDSAPAAPEPTLVVANYGTEIYRGPQSGWGQFKLQPGVLYNLTAQLIERPDSAPVIVGVDLASGPDVTGYMCAKHGALDEPHCYQCDYESL